MMQIRADFTVKGTTVGVIMAEANEHLERLKGNDYSAHIASVLIEVDSRAEPQGTITLWRGEVQAHLNPKSEDEEPF